MNLRDITLFEEFISERAFNLASALRSSEYKVSKYPSEVSYDYDKVDFKFCEDSNRDYGNSVWVSLTQDQIDMSDTDWDTYVNDIRLKAEADYIMNNERIQQVIRQNKLREFENLKKELGI